MKSNEILLEYYVDPGIVDILTTKGYKRLGRGQDQIAFLEPSTGMVLKIFGSSESGDKGFTKPQMSFKVFADYCQEHPDNEFLPQFSGWETFKFKGRNYLQIRVERLFPFPGVEKWAQVLEEMTYYAERSKSPVAKKKFIDNNIGYNKWDNPNLQVEQLLSHLGEDGFNKLWDTINDLSKVAKKNRLFLDLHSGNFMMGSDGEIVISDPFFTGWGNR